MKPHNTSVSITQLNNDELLVNVTFKIRGSLKKENDKVLESSRKESQKLIKKLIDNTDLPSIGVTNEES